jgi:hypothetical protein
MCLHGNKRTENLRELVLGHHRKGFAITEALVNTIPNLALMSALSFLSALF